MKISNGSVLECTIGVLLILFGPALFKIIGAIVVGHCIYLWIQIRKNK